MCSKSEFQHGGYLNEFYRRITKGVSSALAIITPKKGSKWRADFWGKKMPQNVFPINDSQICHWLL